MVSHDSAVDRGSPSATKPRRMPGSVALGAWGLPLPSALELLAHPGARQRNDESTARAFNAADLSELLPRGLSLRWLGTAGFELIYDGHRLLIDPYLTRTPAKHVLQRRVTKPNMALLREQLPTADTIVVGHTHFDHALDVAAIAGYTGARVLGSPSLAHLMGLHGLHAQAEQVEARRVYARGPFEITFIDSVHSKLLLGLKVPNDGEITCDHLECLTPSAFCCGRVYGIHIAVAGVSFYHQGSANLVEDALIHNHVDFFLCGIAGRGFTPHYTARVLSALSPDVVIAHHHDNFFLPIHGPMGFSFNVNLGGFVEEVEAVSKDFKLRVFSPLQRVERRA